MTVSMVTSGEADRGTQRPGAMGMLADAVALQESGILVAGMTVTDLSSGYVAAGEFAAQHPDYLLFEGGSGAHRQEVSDTADDVRYKRTELSLGRLEELYELVDEVVQHRYSDPVPSSMNPAEPRMRFPFGVGLRDPDVLVVGAHANVVSHYLRLMGLRARPLDTEPVWKVAAELEEARADVDAAMFGEPSWPRGVEQETGFPGDGGSNDRGDVASTEHPSVDARAARLADASPQMRWRKSVLVVMAVAMCLIGGGVAGWSLFGSERPGGADVVNTAGEEGSSSTVVPESPPVPEGGSAVPQPPQLPQPPPFKNHQRAGQGPEQSAVRARIPVALTAPGWRRVAATEGQEEFHHDDPGMRVLVAAKSTPLQNQEELDAAMHAALAQHPDVQIVGVAPVSYVERFPESTTMWHVRWVNGHQMSVGCQYREITPERERRCAEAVESASPDLTAPGG